MRKKILLLSFFVLTATSSLSFAVDALPTIPEFKPDPKEVTTVATNSSLLGANSLVQGIYSLASSTLVPSSVASPFINLSLAPSLAPTTASSPSSASLNPSSFFNVLSPSLPSK